ncbi:MAG: hypothetical protein HY905_26335 [Deltaproteobacteria bacterium]|nr:hypothetical protein [Deltaproteobacteria bacterium]
MRGPLPVLLLIVACGAGRTSAARTCDADDLDVIEAILGELGDASGGAGGSGGAGPDERALEAAALEAGCEWPAAPGGTIESLDLMRWREGGAGLGPGGAPEPWWRIFLPRVELRWMGAFEGGGRAGGTHEGWSGRLELWVLWSVVPAW